LGACSFCQTFRSFAVYTNSPLVLYNAECKSGGVQKLSGAVFCKSGGVQKLSGAVFCTDETAEKLTILDQINGELI